MSQYPYPPPPQPPPSYYAPPPPADLLGPGRRAGAMTIVLGGLLVAVGVCTGAAAAVFANAAGPDFDQFRRQMTDQTHASPNVVLAVLAIFAAVGVALGGSMVVLGIFVRRGGRGPAIAGIVLVGLLALYATAEVLFSLPQIGNPQVLGGACMFAVMDGLCVTLVVMLVGAVRNAGRIADAGQQYDAYYAHYQQTAQAYGSGYGYGYPPPPGPYAGQGPVEPPVSPRPPLPPAE